MNSRLNKNYFSEVMIIQVPATIVDDIYKHSPLINNPAACFICTTSIYFHNCDRPYDSYFIEILNVREII